MRSKDILKMLNDEVDELSTIDKTTIASTPIKVRSREEMSSSKVHKPFVKTRAFQALCACMVCVAIVVGVLVPVLIHDTNSGGNTTPPVTLDTTSESYVSLEINPSIDFVLDGNGNVTKVLSKNNDGDIMLTNQTYRESVIGKRLDIAIQNTLAEATKLGFIDAKNRTKKKAMRVSVSSDNDAKAEKLLTWAEDSAKSYFKENTILMAVGGRVVDSDILLESSGLSSVEEWNDSVKTKDDFFYINNVANMDKTAILEAFRRDFMGNYIADAIDEIFENIQDIMDIAKDIEELDDELTKAQVLLGKLPKKYFAVINDAELMANEDIADIAAELSEVIDKYNEELVREEENDSDYVDMSNTFYPIDNDLSLDVLIKVYTTYKINAIDYEEIIDNLIDKIDEDIDNLDSVLYAIDGLLNKIFGNVSDITENIRKVIDSKIAEIELETDRYYEICKREIESSYGKLVDVNINNRSDITKDEYEDLLEELYGKDFDFDDLWESTHRH